MDDARAILVIGVGNPLRGDDAVGPEVAARIELRAGLHSQVRVCSVFQLTPELALDISESRAAILVDASVELSPGRVAIARLFPRTSRRGLASPRGPLGHHVAPGEIVELALAAFGQAPPTWVVGIGASRFDMGTGLSPAVECAAERAACRFLRLLEGRAQGKADVAAARIPRGCG